MSLILTVLFIWKIQGCIQSGKEDEDYLTLCQRYERAETLLSLTLSQPDLQTTLLTYHPPFVRDIIPSTLPHSRYLSLSFCILYSKHQYTILCHQYDISMLIDRNGTDTNLDTFLPFRVSFVKLINYHCLMSERNMKQKRDRNSDVTRVKRIPIRYLFIYLSLPSTMFINLNTVK